MTDRSAYRPLPGGPPPTWAQACAQVWLDYEALVDGLRGAIGPESHDDPSRAALPPALVARAVQEVAHGLGMGEPAAQPSHLLQTGLYHGLPGVSFVPGLSPERTGECRCDPGSYDRPPEACRACVEFLNAQEQYDRWLEEIGGQPGIDVYQARYDAMARAWRALNPAPDYDPFPD